MTTSLFRAARWFAAGISTLVLASAAFAGGFDGLSFGDGLPSGQLFKAKLEVTETIAFTGALPCFAIATVQGTGVSTPLGKVTATAQDCINPLGVFNPGSLSNTFGFATTPQGMAVVAANGDRVSIAYGGTLTARASRPHQLVGYFVITGGTGKYAKATGGGVLFGQQDLSQVVSARGEINAVGTISY